MCQRGCQTGCSLFWSFIYLFTGLLVIGPGIWYLADKFVFDTEVMEDPELRSDSIRWQGFVGGLLAVGAYCVLIGILGMVASGCESKGALIAFLVFGSIGVIGCIALAGLATASFATSMVRYHGDDREELISKFADNLRNNYADENATDVFTMAWNRYQTKLSCCGMKNFTDYAGGVFTNNTGYMAPWTCCVMQDNKTDVTIDDVRDLEMCRQEAETPPIDGVYEYLKTQGCEDDVVSRYRINDIIVVGVGWGVVFFQIISLIVSGCLKEDLKISSWTV